MSCGGKFENFEIFHPVYSELLLLFHSSSLSVFRTHKIIPHCKMLNLLYLYLKFMLTLIVCFTQLQIRTVLTADKLLASVHMSVFFDGRLSGYDFICWVQVLTCDKVLRIPHGISSRMKN